MLNADGFTSVEAVLRYHYFMFEVYDSMLAIRKKKRLMHSENFNGVKMSHYFFTKFLFFIAV